MDHHLCEYVLGEQPRTQKHNQIWLWLSPFWQFCLSGFWLAIVPKHWKVILPPLAWCAFDTAWQPYVLCPPCCGWHYLKIWLVCMGISLLNRKAVFFFFNTHICVDKASEGRDQLHRAGMRQHIRLRSETIPLNLRKSEKIKQRSEQVENCEGHSEGQRRWNIREQK